ncbi:MAG: glutamine-hydrolyzing GMP synthase [Myxococcales bacterium]|nr:glutamine-hydrolyzing GMP synthase [Myxococcales bacterium]
MRKHALVLVLDFGSQTTQLIARRVRELGIYCEIHPFSIAASAIDALAPAAIILSGGPASVYGEGAPTIDAALFERDVPILGICYGAQLTAHLLGGKVERSDKREFGAAKVAVEHAVGPFARSMLGEALDVWMSHGDRVTALPPGFIAIGSNPSTPACAIANVERRIYGVQFHPEVTHTKCGRELLEAFLLDTAGLERDWTPQAFVDEAIAKIQRTVGETGRVVLGLSGGVDSTVAAVLCKRALGDRVTCIFVDNGLLRLDEAKSVTAMFQHELDLELVAVDASGEFLARLEGVTDPEQKRKIIGATFIDVFEREANAIGDVRWLAQGTLYPDVIESVPVHGSSVVIKSHHNVGGLPARMNLKLVEPLRELFKDEVRAAGRALGVPATLLGRHPFPGPGLAVRCLGELSRERLEVLRRADAIFIEELRASGQYDEVWQAFAVLLPVRSVGVMGDDRTYDEVVSLRAVNSQDGMTADWSRLPFELLARVSNRIINEVRGVNRVVYDISSKPPATIEWE